MVLVVGTIANMDRNGIKYNNINNHNFNFMAKIDKRTKAYRDAQKALKQQSDSNTLEKKDKPSEGVGDTLEKVFEKTGVKKVVDWMMNGKDCGCQDRKAWLNEKFRYKAECLVKSEYDYLIEYKKRHNPKRFESNDVRLLLNIHHRTLGVRPKVCRNCNSGVKIMNDVVEHLTNLMTAYEN